MNIHINTQRLLLTIGLLLYKCNNEVLAALGQSDEGKYLCEFEGLIAGCVSHYSLFVSPFSPALFSVPSYHIVHGTIRDCSASFDSFQAATYAVADGNLPPELDVCKNDRSSPTREVTVQSSSGSVDSAAVSGQCGSDSVCVIPLGTTLRVDASLNLGALIVRGAVEWNEGTQVRAGAHLCAGYVAVEGQGRWDMDLRSKDAYIYIKDNGAMHGGLRSRAFGSFAFADDDYPIIDISGRELKRTWSLLSDPVRIGDDELKLMHNAHLMGW